MTYRFNGPLGSSGRPPETIDSGTSALTEHRAPGLVDVLKAATRAGPLLALGPAAMPAAAAYTVAQLWYAKNLHALVEVRDRALALAPAAIAEETGLNDIGKLLQSLLYGLLGSLLALAATTALGGTIGGVVGFFFFGAGAAPGAVAGAKLGFDLGLALLTWVGVGFLATSIATGFAELVQLQTSAVRRGWMAGDRTGPGRAGEIEAAAQDLAHAAGVFVRLILEGILAYLMRKAPAATTRNAMGTIGRVGTASGAEAVAAETVAELVAQLRRSKLGKGFADWVELNWKKLLDNPKLRPRAQGGAGPAPGPARVPKEEPPAAAKRPPKERPPTEEPPPPPETHTRPTGARDGKPTGTRTEIHENASKDEARALRRENESADQLAKAGYKVEQNPTVPGTKNPDYLIEGKRFDCKAPSSGNPKTPYDHMEKAITEGQADRFVLNLEDSAIKPEAMKQFLNEHPLQGLKEVIVIKDGQITPFWP